ncbi:MAG TPA: DJ-1/PfpI family protein [Gammaproteobacteria bacterium]|nr:DJ-1/PfpI family protein [Gammaproteobacteria bacterium]
MTRVLIPLAEGFEELEAVTVVDLLRRAQFEVIAAGLGGGEPVEGSRGTVVVPDSSLDVVLPQEFEMIVLPGGLPGSDNLNRDPRIHQLLRGMVAAGKYVAAICAAPKVLASAGLLAGKRATAFPGVLEQMDVPDIRLSPDAVVRDGNIITSRGPGTAMDFALELVEVLAGKERRKTVEMALQRINEKTA